MRGAQPHRFRGPMLSATFIGAVFTLLVILCFYAYRQIARERERMLADLRLKGTTLVHSLEAGARVGMVGMMGGRQQLQTLLEEAARDPEILAIEVLNEESKILGSTQRTRVGTIADDPWLRQVLSSGQPLTLHEGGVFQLLAPFHPSTIDTESAIRRPGPGTAGTVERPIECPRGDGIWRDAEGPLGRQSRVGRTGHPGYRPRDSVGIPGTRV